MEDNKKEKGKGKKSAKKSTNNGFSDFKNKMESTPKLVGENFRNFAERIGVPSEKVAEFKQYLNKNNGRKK